jgi:hypothetical protein
MSDVLAVAHHEAGHAVAIVTAFRSAVWLPYPPPLSPVRHVQVMENQTGEWSGDCVGTNIYSMRWPIDCIAPRYRDLMERQVVIHLSGGIAEAIHRGERRKSEVLAFALRHCCIDADLRLAADVLSELRRLTGYRFEARDFVGRTLTMLLEHRPAVEALAEALIEDGRIEGQDVERIIKHSIGSASS